MNFLYTYGNAIDELPPIECDKLRASVIHALFLYLQVGANLSYSVRAGAKKGKAKTIRSVDAMVRKIVPEEVIRDRMVNSFRKKGRSGKSQCLSACVYNYGASSHLSSIRGE